MFCFVYSVFIVLFYVLFLCSCVLYYCQRVLTQLQLTNISYHNKDQLLKYGWAKLQLCTFVGKGKAVPLQARRGPEGSRKLRFPDLFWQRHKMVVGCQPYAPAAFTPGNAPGAHFC